ncbi:DUF4351 domain-containing protein [Nostoc sp. TCL240-02]|uniref:DUF4351 domain-containing protein n=1 Tax=Nostoc sp. TCL240-02 TaxID=2572090 RepID=UPI00157FAB46|nr:DUF4351 domain-containing protein [Nostoc sp. TCL240-02]QKQ77679.1 DUF4351 domain-containing protein [Nostoc sp. TCL240-02]
MRYVTTEPFTNFNQTLFRGFLPLFLRLLQRPLGELSPQLQKHMQSISLNQLETLGETLLNFTTMEDLLHWLQTNLSISLIIYF